MIRRRAIRRFFGVLLFLFVPVWMSAAGKRGRVQGSAHRRPDVKAALDDYLKTTNAEIEAIDARNAKLPKSRIGFSSNMILAYGTVIARVPDDVLFAYADGLKETGIERVDINPSVDSTADPRVMAKYDALVKHLRGIGLELAINPEYEHPKQAHSSFAAYQGQALRMYREFAARYKPEYFVLVHEPTTMAARMHIQTTPEQWRAFIVAAAKVVKEASPKTRVGAGCFAGMSDREMPFFAAFAKIPELEFLTVDNYVSHPEAIARMQKMVEIAHAARKPVYMEETWRPHLVAKGGKHKQGASMESQSLLGFGDAVFQPVDVKWLRAMALFAATHGMETMTPFQTRCFFAYTDVPPFDGPGYDKKVEAAIAKRERTETFRAFQQVVREYSGR